MGPGDLLAIDDFVLAEHGIGAGLVTKESRALSFSTRRHEGVAGSVFFGRQAEPATWEVLLRPESDEQKSALMAALGGAFREERRLTARRERYSDERIVIDASLVDIREQGQWDFYATFESGDSVWRSDRITRTEKAFASTLDQTMRLAVPGNAPTLPIVRLLPTAHRAAPTAVVGWRYRQRWRVQNNSDEPLWRYPVRISLGSTTALVSGGKAQADGDDVRVMLNGVEQQRTLVGWNTSASHVWVIVPACRAGGHVDFEIWYGNSAATAGPALAYPNLPPFTLTTSTNALWIYPVNPAVGNAGLGMYSMSNGLEGALIDYAVPGAWYPVLTLDFPESSDIHYVERGVYSGVTWYQARMLARRGAAGSQYDVPETTSRAQRNPYDGMALKSPFGIVSVRADWFYYNDGGYGSFVLLVRNSGSEGWSVLVETNSIASPFALNTLATYSPPAPVKEFAQAVWPKNRVELPQNVQTAVTVASGTTLEVTIDTTDLSITQIEAETEIYELATELRLGGGANGVPGYRAILIGNARGESGAGTRRAAVKLTEPAGSTDEMLQIDGDARTATIWTRGDPDNGDAPDLVEPLSNYAIRALMGVDGAGETTEYPTSEWLALAPGRTVVPNGTFAADASSWEVVESDADLTVDATHWDGTTGGEADGAYEVDVTASAGDGGSVVVLCTKHFGIYGRESIDVAAWLKIENADMAARLVIAYYDGDGLAMEREIEDDWTPSAGVGVRRWFAARVPPNAATFRVGYQTDAPVGETGSTWADDFTVGGVELLVADEAMGALTVEALVAGRWV